MNLNPYLNFNGDCRQAFEFYKAALGGEILMMSTFADSPMADQAPPGMGDKIIHARLAVGDKLLMGSDNMQGDDQGRHGFAVSVVVDTPEEADRAFSALSEGANVRMPMAETFWALRFGMLTDKFGVPWMVNCERAPATGA